MDSHFSSSHEKLDNFNIVERKNARKELYTNIKLTCVIFVCLTAFFYMVYQHIAVFIIGCIGLGIIIQGFVSVYQMKIKNLRDNDHKTIREFDFRKQEEKEK